MKELKLTDGELNSIKQGLIMLNDYRMDTLFEDIPELFPTTDQPIVLTHERASSVREQLDKIFDEVVNLRTSLMKCGLTVNSKGYVE